jgi:hypothetical protein
MEVEYGQALAKVAELEGLTIEKDKVIKTLELQIVQVRNSYTLIQHSVRVSNLQKIEVLECLRVHAPS